jgi:hypothetical protein
MPLVLKGTRSAAEELALRRAQLERRKKRQAAQVPRRMPRPHHA